MKYQRLVSSTTPSSLQEWLEQELENRSIDGVYARYILSLLQQDNFDVEPFECDHAKNAQHKVLHKYGGPESLYSVTKSKHQKWKTWSKQILLTSGAACCTTISCDLERMKKRAAIECLRSASEHINDVDKLIDEVCFKLKNIKNLGGKKDEDTRQRESYFYISPSSPTEEVEKYFAAFPPLTGRIEQEPELSQPEFEKNVWCGNCFMKTKCDLEEIYEPTYNNSNVQKKENKSFQPVIPYSSLKAIKNVYKNESTAVISSKQEKTVIANNLKLSPLSNCNTAFVSLTDSWSNNNQNKKQKISLKLFMWSMKSVLKLTCLCLPFENLHLCSIRNYMYNKLNLLNLAAEMPAYKVAETIFTFKHFQSVHKELENNDCSKISFEKSDVIAHKSDEIFKWKTCVHFDHAECGGCSDSSNCVIKHSEDQSCRFIKPTVPLHSFLRVEYVENPFFSHSSINKEDTLKCFLESSTKTDAKASTCRLNSAFVRHLEMYDFVEDQFSNVVCNNITNEHGSTMFCASSLKTLTSENTNVWDISPCPQQNVQECIQPNQSTLFPVSKSSCFLNHQRESKFLEVMPCRKSQNILNVTDEEDEIFYSDDDSCEIFNSDDDENLFTSSKTHFQPIQQNFRLHFPEVEQEDYNYSAINVNFTSKSSFGRELPSASVVSDNYLGQKLLKKALCIKGVNLPFEVKGRNDLSSSSFVDLGSFVKLNKDYEITDAGIDDTLKWAQSFRDNETNTDNVHKLLYYSKIDKTANILNEDNFNLQGSQLMQNCQKMMGRNSRMEDSSGMEYIWEKELDKDYARELQKTKKTILYDKSALRKEINEEAEELLRGLFCAVTFDDDSISSMLGNELVMPEHVSLHSDEIKEDFEFIKDIIDRDVPDSDILVPSKAVSDVTDCNKIFNEAKLTVPLHSANNLYNIDMCENELIRSQPINSDHYVLDSKGETYQATDFFDLSAFQGSFESLESHAVRKDSYTEGGGWSLASDSFLEVDSEAFYDGSYSLENLDTDGVKNECYNFVQDRQSYPSETEECTKMSFFYKGPSNHIRKRMKQKHPPWKRPCSFFMEGNCHRSDCKFSHDLSSITCRFWQENACFKGITCPFLHGYINEKETSVQDDYHLQSDVPDQNYSLESEADFPSLASSKPVVSMTKSDPVDIVQERICRKKRKKEKSQSNSLRNGEQEISSSWQGYKSM